MTERGITKCNRSNHSDTIFFERLALPGRDRPEVQVCNEDGTAGTDLERSDTFAALLNRLGLNQDPNHRGCNAFYLTITTRRPALLTQQ